MPATFAAPSKQIALSVLGVFEMPDPCRAPQSPHVETKDRCCGKPWELAARAARDTLLDRDTRSQAACARCASAHQKLLPDVRTALRELRRPRLSETRAPNRTPPSGPCRSPSCRQIRPRPAATARNP